jgi:menaquinone-dependent protoporphyrinogen oxidase
MKKVLIVYGTRYGSTREISQEIEKVLRENDIEVKSVNIEDKKEIPALDKFDGVLIGSSIKIGKMTKHIRKFIDKNADKLQNRENILGIFISCGTAGEEGKRPKAKQDYIESILKEKNLNVDMYDAFGGVFDLTEDSNIGFLGKKILKMMAKEDPNITPGQKNDQRNWEYIREFANNFCSQLTAE